MALMRGCSPDLLSALSGHFHPAVLIEAEWHDGVHRVHSGRGEMTWDGETWLGVGIAVSAGANLVDFAGPAEAEGMTAEGGMLRVAATLETVLSEKGKLIRNRPVHVWFGVTTEAAGDTLETDPVLLFTGYFDERRFPLARQGEDFSHDLTLGLGLGPAPRAQASVVHSAEDQERAYPGDTAGRHLINAEKHRVNPPVWPEP